MVCVHVNESQRLLLFGTYSSRVWLIYKQYFQNLSRKKKGYNDTAVLVGEFSKGG